MSSTESTEPAPSVYDSCDPKYLRDLREACGMDLFVLARTACLSVAQVRQLESDAGGNLFYSRTIKRQAYKRLLMILGAEPPTVEVPEAFRHAHQVAQAHLNTLDQIVAMSHLPRMARSTGDVWRECIDKLVAHKQVMGALLMLLVAVLLFMKFGEPQRHEPAWASSSEIDATSASAAPAPAPAPAPAVTPAVTPATAAVVAAPVPTPAATGASAANAPARAVAAVATTTLSKPPACAYTDDELVALTSFAANKEGRYVYLLSHTDIDICLVDGAKKATPLSLKAGEGRSVYGAPPWQISGANMQKVQIYFQGGRVSLPDATPTRVKLIEVPVSRGGLISAPRVPG